MKNQKRKPVMDPTSWGRVAEWYDETVEEEDSYQQNLILPNLLRLMEIKKGERILDLACGQGFFARAFDEAGGTVTAADISSELIEIAEQKSSTRLPTAFGQGEIVYHIAPAHSLPFLKDGETDKVAIVLALQNIENVNETLGECARVLVSGGTPPHQSHTFESRSHKGVARPPITNDWCGGKLYLVLNHPAFRIPKQSSWGFDEKAKVQYRRIDRYLSSIKTKIEMHPGKKRS